ncbi:MAG: nucleoside hydrolase [Nanoarchaeota archaeon]
MKNKIPIIIDTDPGHDDALAIMFAVKSGIFDIKAITTVAGNSTIENTTRNARYILKLLDREDISVYSGSAKPLVRELIKAVVHGESGLEGIDPKNESKLTNDAVDKIIKIVKENENITLVTLGPLTNIARAIEEDNEAMKRVKQIVIMGGAIKVPGNKDRVAEFNIFVDPDAANIVFNFPVKKFLVPLDACNHVQLQLEDFEKLNGTSLYEPIMAMMKPYIENIFKDEGIKAALMYDPLTIYYLFNPDACKVKEYDLKIETKGELTRGMTVAELRSSTKDYNINVIETIDGESFKKDFINILKQEK